MLNEKLKSFKYYLDKLPRYLQESPTFPEHFRIWVEFLNGIDKAGDDMLGMINIFDKDYLKKYGDRCEDLLDMIGQLYGVTRNFSVTYTLNNVETTDTLALTQDEFLLLIKAQIIKNFFNGTYEQITQFYTDANLPILMLSMGDGICIAYLYQIKGISDTANIVSMFRAGLLTIESIGIAYQHATIQLDDLLIWDDTEEPISKWDEGEWIG